MDIISADYIAVPATGVCGGLGAKGIAGNPLDVKIQSLSQQMPAVGDSACLVGIVPGTTDAAGRMPRPAKMCPQVVHQLHKGLIRFHRKAAAIGFVILAAAAPEFLPAPIADMIPEIPGGNIRGLFQIVGNGMT